MIEFLKTPAGLAVFWTVAAAVIIFILDVNYRFFAKRVLDFIFACLFTVILSPVLAVCAVISKIKAGAVYERKAFLGARGKIIFVREYAAFNGVLNKLPRILDVVCGRLSFVGVSLLPVSDGAFIDDDGMSRFNAKPGIFNHLVAGGYAGITYGEAFALDARYAKKRELFYDIFVVIKSVIFTVRGESGVNLGETCGKNYAEALAERGAVSEEDLKKSEAYAAEAIENYIKHRDFKKNRYIK